MRSLGRRSTYDPQLISSRTAACCPNNEQIHAQTKDSAEGMAGTFRKHYRNPSGSSVGRTTRSIARRRGAGQNSPGRGRISAGVVKRQGPASARMARRRQGRVPAAGSLAASRTQPKLPRRSPAHHDEPVPTLAAPPPRQRHVEIAAGWGSEIIDF